MAGGIARVHGELVQCEEVERAVIKVLIALKQAEERQKKEKERQGAA